MDKKLFQLGRMISFLGFADAGLTWLLAYNGYCTMIDVQMGESLPQLIGALRDEGDLYPCIFTLLIVLLAVAALVLLFRKKSRVSRMSLVYGVVCGLFVVTLTASALITVFAVLSVLDGALTSFLREWRFILIYVLFAASGIAALGMRRVCESCRRELTETDSIVSARQKRLLNRREHAVFYERIVERHERRARMDS